MAIASAGNTTVLPDFPPLKEWIDAGSGDPENKSLGWRRVTGVIGCPAAILMQEAGIKGEPLEARTLRVFDTGHRVESQIVQAIYRSGHPLFDGPNNEDVGALRGIPEDVQEECQVTVGIAPHTITVPGHLDGRVSWNGQEYIVDVKSMSDFAFDRLEKGEVDDKYLDQFNLYMRGTGTRWCACIGVRKETSHIAVSWVPYDEKRLEQIDLRVAAVLSRLGGKAVSSDMVAELGWCVAKKELKYQRTKPVGYIPTGREEARQKHEDGMPATYCSYASVCPKVGKGGFEFVIDGGKPKWIRDASKEKA